ncbi:response regulator [Geomesophilobacter sediminis]|uniref:Response regulator n=1 Tax=Geomesophilobacter sediminis TaxID=2798584 RepID=A0A8J7M2B9_9BACT|nr:response regulator [Geomesophilobacter sediminis]MBJ6727377.1 response regulator [Geomesophilobacter sediminis]
MTIEEAFGVVIRRLRRDHGFSQEKLSVYSGLDRTFISNIEGGKQQPSLVSIFAFANALKISVSAILREVELVLGMNSPETLDPNGKNDIIKVFNDMDAYLNDIDASFKGSETILFADDEDMLLELMEKFLTGCGYRVLTAKDGQEASDIYKTRMGDISVVVLDVLMPGLSGVEAYHEIKKVNPDAQVIFISGYSADGLKGLTSPRILQKPFSPVDLLREIRSSLV